MIVDELLLNQALLKRATPVKGKFLLFTDRIENREFIMLRALKSTPEVGDRQSFRDPFQLTVKRGIAVILPATDSVYYSRSGMTVPHHVVKLETEIVLNLLGEGFSGVTFEATFI